MAFHGPKAIGTAIPHSGFDDPECCGCLNVLVESGIVEFICNECKEIIACTREGDLRAFVQILEFFVGTVAVTCTHCGFTNQIVGLDTVFAFCCRRCGERVAGSDAASPPVT